MDLGSNSMWGGSDGRSVAELLDGLTASVQLRRQCEIEEFKTIVAWADANTVEDLEGAATIREGFLDTGIPIAGEGAPLVSEFGLMELCATLERSLDGGREYVGKIVETGWRLPQIRDAVYAGRVPVWKALRVADLTRSLSADAAGFVDRHLAFALPTCSWAQVERLVTEAIDRHDPDAAEERHQDAADHRCFQVFTESSRAGVTHVAGTLDAADALDLDQAVSRRATALGQLGCAESLEVRRAIAVGEIARQDLTLDLQVADPDTGEITRTVPGRKVELFVHLTDHALQGVGNVGRLGNTQTPVSVEQIRHWCGVTGSTVIVRPVIDLKDHVPVDSYEIPDRHRTRVQLRDHTCRAPYCNRRAERCDLDHAVPHSQGGPTCPCQLVPLCRRHHRAKTFDHWRYTIVEPGTYLWSSPNDRHWLVDHTGTRTLDPPRRLHPDSELPEWADPGWTEPGWADPGWTEPAEP